MHKLPRSQARTMTLKVWQDQGRMCPVCKKGIDIKIKGEAVMDHDHTTGECRGVLHRSCNAALGKVDNAAGRWGAKSMEYSKIIEFLENMLVYYKAPGLGFLYHSHLTPEEAKAKANTKRRSAAAAKKAAIAVKKL